MKYVFLYGLAATFILAAAFACFSPRSRGTVDVPPVKISRALNTILLSEHSEEAGPVRFPHRRHYASSSEGGKAVPCGTCHHDYEEPYESAVWSCRTCHPSQHDATPGDRTL